MCAFMDTLTLGMVFRLCNGDLGSSICHVLIGYVSTDYYMKYVLPYVDLSDPYVLKSQRGCPT